MKAGRASAILLAAVAALCLGPATALAAPAPTPPGTVAEDGFRTEGSFYVCVASGTGSSAQAAEAAAKSAALHDLFAGLGKDGLFAEVFAASPPIGLTFQILHSSSAGLLFTAKVELKVDDESVRLVAQGPYLASAVGILDKAEVASDEAEARQASASAAEADGKLGSALGQYGMAVDACRSALPLIEPLGDPSVFSTKGKRTAIDLKKGLASLLAEASAGVDRVKKAEDTLAADASSSAASKVADSALAATAEAQALLDEINPILGDLSAYDEDKLSPLRDRISMQRRKLSDSMAELARAQDSLLQRKGGFAAEKLDFARRRLVTADQSLETAFMSVDREIRDPYARRAARARAIRWAFLHEPREYLSLRAYSPFMVAPREGGLSSAPFDASLGLEGAFPIGSGGVWVRSKANETTTELLPREDSGDELALTQSFDFGVWGKSLLFVGYQWDWLRRVDGQSFPKYGSVEIGTGGVYEHNSSGEVFKRADWLLSLSYELPYSMPDLRVWNAFNVAINAQFRLGNIALLEGTLAKRLDELSEDEYTSILLWSVGMGLRLPHPFTLGIEYFGSIVQPMLEDGSLGKSEDFQGGEFRFYVQYSI